MSAAPSEYLAAAAVWAIRNRGNSPVPQDRNSLNRLISVQYGNPLEENEIEWLIRRLKDWGAVVAISDKYAGEILAFSDFSGSIEGLRQRSKVVDDTYKIGHQWLANVLSSDRFRRDLEREFSAEPAEVEAETVLDQLQEVPASDRMVRLDHNQITKTDAQTTELIEALESDNGDPSNPGMRERLIGQIRAGRELIRAGEFKAYLLYEVLVQALGELIEKYGNPTIKALAHALLGAVVSQILEG